MFKTSYPGKIELLGSGSYTSSWMARRSVIKIGNDKIRNVFVSNYIDSFLESSVEEDEDVSLAIGWALFYRWVLSVKYKNEVYREGLFLFIAGMVTHFFLMGFVFLIVATIIESYMSHGLGIVAFIALFLYLVMTLILNIKAWLKVGY